MTTILMNDGTQFTVTETAEEVLIAIGNPRGQGGRPGRPGFQNANFVTLTKEDDSAIYINADSIVSFTEE